MSTIARSPIFEFRLRKWWTNVETYLTNREKGTELGTPSIYMMSSSLMKIESGMTEKSVGITNTHTQTRCDKKGHLTDAIRLVNQYYLRTQDSDDKSSFIRTA